MTGAEFLIFFLAIVITIIYAIIRDDFYLFLGVFAGVVIVFGGRLFISFSIWY